MAINKKKRRRGGGGSQLRGAGKDFREAGKIADEFGFTNPLGRIDTSQTDALLDPNNAAYVGKRSDQGRNLMEALQNNVANAGKRSDQMNEILGMMRSGLAGLNAQENQALREQAQREVDRQYAGAMSKLVANQARFGARGAQASAQIANEGSKRAQTQSEMEQDLLVKNIGIQDERRNAYQGALGGQEQAEFGRTKESLDQYGNTMRGLESDEFDRAQGLRQHQLEQQKTNLGQGNAEQAARLASILGLTNYGLQRWTTRKNYDLAKRGMARGGRGPSSGGGGGGNAALIDELTKLGNEHFGT